ncbi:hypothetical protein E2562_009920 [Oryza meyeriana var. granulata]|uniref:Rx N-terminal domain-containing protein n=1 Tax=Oryza meyeriana var. granulata TaxID=110450 RepID=A0A6G1BUU1_9ORYZ|nr:hypothetical protein E2562_009920 [Oryza meyeriana var. granulata]
MLLPEVDHLRRRRCRVMESLLGKLSSMLEKEYTKRKTVEKDVLFLRNELSSMNTVMQKYAMLNEPDLQVKTWMKEVRELAYDIEDIIDAFMARNEKTDEPTGVKGFIINNILKLKELFSSCTISQEIEELKNQVLEVNDRRKRYKLDVSVSMTGCESVDPRLPAFYSEVGGLVGIDGPRDEIIKLLREEAADEDCGFVNQLTMVSITGFGDMKRILLDLLSELGTFGNMLDGERQLIDKIREFLHDKRYFIVIDDIWSISSWEILKLPKWMSIFDNLIHLELYISRMEMSDINILKGISTLLILRLVFTGHAPLGRVIIDNQGFQALKEFFLLCFIPGIWPVFAAGAMQKLQKYHLTFKLQKVECNSGVLDFGLQHLSSLQHITAIIIPAGAAREDTLVAEDAIRSVTSVHPNQPTVEIFVQ